MTKDRKPRAEWAIVVGAVGLAVLPAIISFIRDEDVLRSALIGPALAIVYVGLWLLIERLSKRAAQRHSEQYDD